MLNTLQYINEDTLIAIDQEKALRKTHELFLLFPLGSQFDHLIKQQLERLGVYCLVANPATITAADVQKLNPVGIILSGGPASVHQNPPPFDDAIFELGIPVLGICLGFQLWAKHLGFKVSGAEKREFGVHEFIISKTDSPLLAGCREKTPVLQSHGDWIVQDPKLSVLGATVNAPVSAGNFKHLWGVQFHPEVSETETGPRILENFCFIICGAKDAYPAGNIAQKKIQELKAKISEKKVLLALSGGCDSSVVAYLLKQAVENKPGQVCGVYIKGIDRPDDETHVHEFFSNESWLELKVVDATDDFLRVLKGKTTMHDKRLAMREIYKPLLEKEAADFGANFIAQGTLYTDISESGGGYHSGAEKAQIKLHHNTGLNFNLPELSPLDDCVKDSARNIGRELGVPEPLLLRHPFPGPGLVVRIEGEVNNETLKIARQADKIYIEELRGWKLYDSIWQAGAVVTTSMTTCTKGDDKGKGRVIELWAVWSVNGFTARPAELSYDFLNHVATRITNEIAEVGSVSYRISGKPPATIEKG